MKYKMVICDLDDTLIDSSGTGDGTSQFTVDTIAEYMGKGGIFTISTGRNMGSALRQVKGLGIEGKDVPIMSLNGTYVINCRTGESLREIYIDSETALKMAYECEKRGLNFHLYDKNYAYVTNMEGDSKAYLEYTKSPAKEISKVSDFIINKKPNCMKMLLMGSPEVLKTAREDFEKLFPSLSFLTSNEFLVEIISKESGKGNALKFASEKFGVPISEIMAVGDSMNDYSMIEIAGLGVAMGNACDELKSIAAYITDTCKNDGAAKAIKKFCL